MAKRGDSDLDRLMHYLQPALDDLKRMDMQFETYLLEMLLLSLKDHPPVHTPTFPLEAIPA